MIGYYEITQAIKDELKTDKFVNTVTLGDIFKVDLNKQTIFPLSHIMINSLNYAGPIDTFNVSILFMDIVDESKQDVTDVFIGNDNEQDVLNTQLMVAKRLVESLRRGDLYDAGYQLNGQPAFEFFVDRFENKIAGVTLTVSIDVPNDMSICG